MQISMARLTVLKLACNVTKAKPQNSYRGYNFNLPNFKASAASFSDHNNKNNELRGKLQKMLELLPIFASGEIVRGFGRGSKELGIPTANLSLEVVKSLPDSLQTGVYYGWANVDNGDVHKMVMSVGWNPFYNNKEKSVETHMLHKFEGDLYGKILKICIAGYLRPEENFNSLEELIDVIKSDIEKSTALLSTPEIAKLEEAAFFKEEIKKC